MKSPSSRVNVKGKVPLTFTNGFAERFVGLFKLAVAERCSYQTLGEFLRAAQAWVQFYNGVRPHESLGFVSPDQFARGHGLPPVPSPTLF